MTEAPAVAAPRVVVADDQHLVRSGFRMILGAAGIPVVIIDSRLNSKLPSSTVSTDNYKGGQIGARRLGAVMGGKGRVVLLRYQVGSNSTEKREAGFLDVMKSDFPGISLISSALSVSIVLSDLHIDAPAGSLESGPPYPW